ncbi:hypothetical protein V6L77_24370 [Pannonibacter sp. Pt2-lr]
MGAFRHARRPQGLVFRRVSLGPDLGQCCGGRVDLALEHFTAEDIEAVRVLVHAQEERGGKLAVLAVFEREGIRCSGSCWEICPPGRISCLRRASSQSASGPSFSRSGCSAPVMSAGP